MYVSTHVWAPDSRLSALGFGLWALGFRLRGLGFGLWALGMTVVTDRLLLQGAAVVSRDHRKLRAFEFADNLILRTTSVPVSAEFPDDEKLGLQAQLRRAAVSIATNIVEGSARRTTREYVQFLNIATGSAAEVQYLLELAYRLKFLSAGDFKEVLEQCTELLKCLKSLVNALGKEP